MSEQNDYSALFRITLMNFLITGVLALGFMTYLYFTTQYNRCNRWFLCRQFRFHR